MSIHSCPTIEQDIMDDSLNPEVNSDWKKTYIQNIRMREVDGDKVTTHSLYQDHSV